ncbi:MAG: leucine-rich repeat domain-containing protein [Paludibacteraceae bacterium]|nr:leucine-rich repeat domain-containing protein [Paludibacteraceae bacterium]
MKKSLLSLLCITMSVMAFAYDFAAKSANDTTLYYNYLGGDSVELVQATPIYSGAIIVPEYVTDSQGVELRVTKIGNNALAGCNGCPSISAISIPQSINHIAERAFADSWWGTGTTDLYLPNLKIIENNAFNSSRMILSLYAPNLETLGSSAFKACRNIKSVVWPDTIPIRGETFSSAVSLLGFNFPKNQDTIYTGTFAGCWMLKQIVIPEQVRVIRSQAFMACMSLKSLFIPQNVDSIGSQVIYGTKDIQGSPGWICDDGVYSTDVGCPYSRYNASNKLSSIYFERPTPPRLHKSAFTNVIKDNVICYVPINSIQAYLADTLYTNAFKEIIGIKYGDVDIKPNSPNSVDFKWKMEDSSITQYTIKIFEKSNLFGEYHICVDGMAITCFDTIKGSQGSSSVQARRIQQIPQQKKDTTYSTDEMYVLTINDLSDNTTYTYEISGMDEQNNILYHDEGTFTTPKRQMTQSDALPIIQDDNKDYTIHANGNKVHINSHSQLEIFIYAIEGQLMYHKRTNEGTIALPSGLYIIQVNGKAQKVVL